MSISRRFIVAALFFTTLTTLAQQPATPSPNLSGIAHVALRVHDLDASVAFYEKLGFIRAFTLSRNGAVYEAFIKINDRQFLELYPTDAKDTQLGFLHVCFEGNGLQSVHDFYVAQGLHPGEVAVHGAGNSLFTMPGPASPTGPQNMEYTQYLPGSLHTKDIGQHLGPDRIATQMTSVAIAVDVPTAAIAFYKELGFTPTQASRTRLNILGAPDKTIDIVPSQPLGFKAELTFNANPEKAAAFLKQHNIPATPILTDPDGNHILFQ